VHDKKKGETGKTTHEKKKKGRNPASLREHNVGPAGDLVKEKKGRTKKNPNCGLRHRKSE